MKSDRDYALQYEIRHLSRGFHVGLHVRWGLLGQICGVLGTSREKFSGASPQPGQLQSSGSQQCVCQIRSYNCEPGAMLWLQGPRFFWLCTGKLAPLPLTQLQVPVATFRMAAILQVQLPRLS